MYRGVKIHITPGIPNLGTRWVVSFTPQPFRSGERDPGMWWIGGKAGSSAGLDVIAKRKPPATAWSPNPVIQPVVTQYTDWAIMVVREYYTFEWLRVNKGPFYFFVWNFPVFRLDFISQLFIPAWGCSPLSIWRSYFQSVFYFRFTYKRCHSWNSSVVAIFTYSVILFLHLNSGWAPGSFWTWWWREEFPALMIHDSQRSKVGGKM
jgi:hypothetical protein